MFYYGEQHLCITKIDIHPYTQHPEQRHVYFICNSSDNALYFVNKKKSKKCKKKNRNDYYQPYNCYSIQSEKYRFTLVAVKNCRGAKPGIFHPTSISILCTVFVYQKTSCCWWKAENEVLEIPAVMLTLYIDNYYIFMYLE